MEGAREWRLLAELCLGPGRQRQIPDQRRCFVRKLERQLTENSRVFIFDIGAVNSCFKYLPNLQCSRDLFSGLTEFSLLLTPIFRPVIVTSNTVFSRFNGLPRECRFGKPLKRLLLTTCHGARLTTGVNDVGPLAEHFLFEIWFGILQLRFTPLTPCPDLSA